MKTPYLIVLLVVAGGAVTSVAEALLVETSAAYKRQETLLAHYRTSPDATLKKISAAFLACADSKYSNGPAAADIRQLAARLMLEAISQRIENVDKVEGKKRGLQLMEKHFPAIKKRFAADRDAKELLNYIQALREDGVSSCVFSTVA